jgi:hypothetical protein
MNAFLLYLKIDIILTQPMLVPPYLVSLALLELLINKS